MRNAVHKHNKIRLDGSAEPLRRATYASRAHSLLAHLLSAHFHITALPALGMGAQSGQPPKIITAFINIHENLT